MASLKKSIGHATIVYLGSQRIEFSELANRDTFIFSQLKEKLRQNYPIFEKRKKVCHNPNEQEIRASDLICKQFKKGLDDAFLNFLSSSPPLDNDGIDLAKIKQELLSKVAKEDISFLSVFVETQMFVSLVEEKYKSFNHT